MSLITTVLGALFQRKEQRTKLPSLTAKNVIDYPVSVVVFGRPDSSGRMKSSGQRRDLAQVVINGGAMRGSAPGGSNQYIFSDPVSVRLFTKPGNDGRFGTEVFSSVSHVVVSGGHLQGTATLRRPAAGQKRARSIVSGDIEIGAEDTELGPMTKAEIL